MIIKITVVDGDDETYGERELTTMTHTLRQLSEELDTIPAVVAGLAVMYGIQFFALESAKNTVHELKKIFKETARK